MANDNTDGQIQLNSLDDQLAENKNTIQATPTEKLGQIVASQEPRLPGESVAQFNDRKRLEAANIAGENASRTPAGLIVPPTARESLQSTEFPPSAPPTRAGEAAVRIEQAAQARQATPTEKLGQIVASQEPRLPGESVAQFNDRKRLEAANIAGENASRTPAGLIVPPTAVAPPPAPLPPSAPPPPTRMRRLAKATGIAAMLGTLSAGRSIGKEDLPGTRLNNLYRYVGDNVMGELPSLKKGASSWIQKTSLFPSLKGVQSRAQLAQWIKANPASGITFGAWDDYEKFRLYSLHFPRGIADEDLQRRLQTELQSERAENGQAQQEGSHGGGHWPEKKKKDDKDDKDDKKKHKRLPRRIVDGVKERINRLITQAKSRLSIMRNAFRSLGRNLLSFAKGPASTGLNFGMRGIGPAVKGISSAFPRLGGLFPRIPFGGGAGNLTGAGIRVAAVALNPTSPVFWIILIIIILLLIFFLFFDDGLASDEVSVSINKSGPEAVENPVANEENLIEYTINVSYSGPVSSLTVTDYLPEELEYVSSEGPVQPTQNGNVLTWNIAGGGSGGTVGSGQNTPPSTDTCGGVYDLSSSGGQNFGDPTCELANAEKVSHSFQGESWQIQKPLFDMVQQMDPQDAGYWFGVIQCESNFHPSVVAIGPHASGAGVYGLYQMGASYVNGRSVPYGTTDGLNGEYDRGDVHWSLQTSNAINYQEKRLGPLGMKWEYWACARMVWGLW